MRFIHKLGPGLIVVFLLAAILPGSLSAQAQSGQSGMQLEIQAAFDGYFKYGEWLLVWAQVENNGPDVEAELLVRVVGSQGTTVYSAAAPLPGGSRKRIPVYVLPNSYSRELEVQLVSGNDLLGSANVPVQPQPNFNYLVGILSPHQGGMALIQAVELPGGRPRVLVNLELDDLPERAEALRSFNTLIFNDVDTSMLTPDQQSALDGWVRQGGRLVIGGGAGALQTVSGLPQNLLPVDVQELVEVQSLETLAEYAGGEEVRLPGPFLAAEAQTTQGNVLVHQDEHNLLVESSLGTGWVDFIALDLAGAPFDAWEGATEFWQTLLTPGAMFPDWLPRDYPARQMRADQMNYALSNLPSLDLPSVRGLTLLLLAYILLIGPVNYVILRWRSRLDWAWITIPVLTLLFSGGAFAVGYLLRGSDLILNKIVIIESEPNGPARLTGYLGLFSPARQNYEIEVDGGGLLSPLRAEYDQWSGSPISGVAEAVFQQGQPGIVRGLTVNQWSMQAFMTETRWEGFGPLQSDLRFEGGTLVGEVLNDSGHRLLDAVLVLGNQYTRLGDLQPGQNVQVNLSMPERMDPRFFPGMGWLIFEDRFSGATGPMREVEVKRTIVDTLFQPELGFSAISSRMFSVAGGATSKPVLLAWLENAPPQVTIEGQPMQQQTTALVYMPMSYTFGDSQNVDLPAGLVPGALVKLPEQGGTCGPQGASVWMERGEAVFEFQIPQAVLGMQLDRLELLIESDGGWFNAPETAIYDWQQATWMNLSGAALGLNLIEEPESLVGADGLVRVRLASGGQGGGGCMYLAMGLEGKQ